jgi:hypothetical protein
MAHSQPPATAAAGSTLSAANSFFFFLTPDPPLFWPNLVKSHYPLLLVASLVILSLSLSQLADNNGKTIFHCCEPHRRTTQPNKKTNLRFLTPFGHL